MARRPKSISENVTETRESLLNHAARVFGEQGYTATTMRSIAEHAGIEAASIYYHFPSKEALIDEVMEQSADRIVHHLNRHIDALGPDATAEQRFRAAVLGQMSALVKYGDFAHVQGRLLAQLPDKARERQVKRREQHQKRWDRLLEDLRVEGRLRGDIDMHLARVFILGSINSIRWWFDPGKGSLEKAADQLCGIFFSGVGPHPGAPSD